MQLDVIGIGYEGSTAEGLVSDLADQNVDVVVDVRLTPLSRKAGLSKRALSEHLQQAGIRYVHEPSLGNPKDNRDGFRSGDSIAFDRYSAVVDLADAAVERIRVLAGDRRVALLCFEAEDRLCHRSMILDRLGVGY